MPSWLSSTANGPHGRRYLGLDILHRSRLVPVTTQHPEEDKPAGAISAHSSCRGKGTKVSTGRWWSSRRSGRTQARNLTTRRRMVGIKGSMGQIALTR